MGYGQQTRGFSDRKKDVSGIKRYKELGYSDCNCNASFSGGVVLDMFAGSGTTGAVAKKLGRQYVLIELNPNYITLIKKRLDEIPEKLNNFIDKTNSV